MALKDVVKISRKTFFNPTGWLGYDSLGAQFRSSWQILKDMFTTPTAGNTETFEQAQQRFNLTEEQIQHISKQFSLFTYILVACGVMTILFSFYLLFRGVFSGFLIGVATTAVFCAYAFRYSFWRFEIIHRKLGCTFNEWWTGKVSPHEDKRNVD